jgi:phage tail tape-measure protein
MTIVELVPVIAALGGGGGIYAVIRAFRGRSAPDADRESPVPQDRPVERARCVTHAELAAAMAQQRSEMHVRIDQTESDCERRTQEAAERTESQLDRLAGQIGTANERIAHIVGLLEGLRDRQAQSRRGR